MVNYKTFFEVNEEILQIYNQQKMDKSFIVSTDSRSFENGQCFIAIKGESFDAAKFMEDILEKGCPILVCQMSDENLEKVEKLSSEYLSTQFIMVKNSIKYIQDVAALHRQKWGGEVIALTGSNGKTTTKEMLYHFMNGIFPNEVIATQGNLNNHLGVPFTLFRVSEEIKYVVLEMGTNHPGEIKVLCDIAVPNHGTITNIGESHLEFFQTKENVLVEKSELFHAVMKNGEGSFVLNCEDPLLLTLQNEYPQRELVKFQNEQNRLLEEKGEYSFKNKDENISLENKNLIGRHNFLNLAQSYLLVSHLFPERKEKLKKLIHTFKPGLGRSVFCEKNGVTFFSDAYNANPSSMRASLQGFIEFLNKNFVSKESVLYIIGDMNELGDLAPELHQEIGEYVKNLGISNPIFVGRYAKHLKDGFQNKDCEIYEHKEDLERQIKNLIDKKKYVFLKASRSLQLESIIDIT